MARNEIPKAGEFYKHFKNKLYQIVAVAEHTETQEKLVIYQALYGEFSVYARPLSMFMSEVDHEKYPDVTQKYRFAKVKFVTKTEEVIQEESKKELAQEEKEIEDSIEINQKVLKTEPEKMPVDIEKMSADTEKMSNENKQVFRKKQYSTEELFYEFLNADTYKEKLEIFAHMKDKADARILTNIAVSLDLAVEEDDLEELYTMIRQNLETYAKFECNRFR